MAAPERAGWDYQAGQAEAQDVLGMTEAEALAALDDLTELGDAALATVGLADAEMAEAFGPCSTECSHERVEHLKCSHEVA